jgi:DNA-binding Lrp family transcriptional regulator
MTMERQFEGVWIPKEIYLNKDLTPTEKMLLAEIRSFSKNGTCFASNEHFSEFLGISKGHVSKLLTKLNKLGLITVELIYKKDSKEVDKRVVTPISFNEYTPTPARVDPLLAEEYTPTHSGLDPLLVDEQDKIQVTNTIKVQVKKNKKINKKNSDSSEFESEFESLWAKYPKKLGKDKALLSYIKARKSGKYTFNDIKNGLNKYIDYIELQGTDEQYIAYGSTWFNQERWKDDYIVTGIQKKPKSIVEYMQQKYGSGFGESDRNRDIIDYDTENVSEFF